MLGAIRHAGVGTWSQIDLSGEFRLKFAPEGAGRGNVEFVDASVKIEERLKFYGKNFKEHENSGGVKWSSEKRGILK